MCYGKRPKFFRFWLLDSSDMVLKYFFMSNVLYIKTLSVTSRDPYLMPILEVLEYNEIRLPIKMKRKDHLKKFFLEVMLELK